MDSCKCKAPDRKVDHVVGYIWDNGKGTFDTSVCCLTCKGVFNINGYFKGGKSKPKTAKK